MNVSFKGLSGASFLKKRLERKNPRKVCKMPQIQKQMFKTKDSMWQSLRGLYWCEKKRGKLLVSRIKNWEALISTNYNKQTKLPVLGQGYVQLTKRVPWQSLNNPGGCQNNRSLYTNGHKAPLWKTTPTQLTKHGVSNWCLHWTVTLLF